MISYTARYKFLDDGMVHAEVMDFPGVITCAVSLEAARRLLQSALVDLAELAWGHGEALPVPGDVRSPLDGDLDEPIHLLLRATRKVQEVPEPSAA